MAQQSELEKIAIDERTNEFIKSPYTYNEQTPYSAAHPDVQFPQPLQPLQAAQLATQLWVHAREQLLVHDPEHALVQFFPQSPEQPLQPPLQEPQPELQLLSQPEEQPPEQPLHVPAQVP